MTALTAARGFPAADLAVPLRITDEQCPANAGRWQLTVRDGTGDLSSCRTERGDTPPLSLGPRGLAALYAAAPVATLRRAGLAPGGAPAADAALDGAFAAAPYMLDAF
jgi:Sterol carrier protein domain